jgi:hypothetical protein
MMGQIKIIVFHSIEEFLSNPLLQKRVQLTKILNTHDLTASLNDVEFEINLGNAIFTLRKN